MKQKKKNDIAALLDYAGSHRGLTFLGLGLSAASMVCSMIPYLCIWLAARAGPQSGRHRGYHHPVYCHAGADVRL